MLACCSSNAEVSNQPQIRFGVAECEIDSTRMSRPPSLSREMSFDVVVAVSINPRTRRKRETEREGGTENRRTRAGPLCRRCIANTVCYCYTTTRPASARNAAEETTSIRILSRGGTTSFPLCWTRRRERLIAILAYFARPVTVWSVPRRDGFGASRRGLVSQPRGIVQSEPPRWLMIAGIRADGVEMDGLAP